MVKWLNYVGLFDPDNKKWGKVGYMIFVALLYDDIKGLFKGIFPPDYRLMIIIQIKTSYGSHFCTFEE